jgi:hypothetical protein
MTRLAQIALGLGLFLIGTAKAMHHLGTVDPMAAYWCRNGATAANDAGFWLFEPHCWGCGLALLGVLLAAHGSWKALACRVQYSGERDARLISL